MRAGTEYRPKSPESGFTLVELMVVIVLIGLLAGAVGVAVFPVLTTGRTTAAKNQIKEFEKAIQFYYMDNSRYPDTLEDLTEVSEQWPEGYLEEIPLDPWDQDYVYDPNGGTRKKYLILSVGEDLEEGTVDDVTNETDLRDQE